MDDTTYRTDYYYANGQKVPLVRERSLFAVRFKPGERADSAELSPASRRMLREDSAHLTFVPKYGLQVYQARLADAKDDTDEETYLDRVARAVDALKREEPIGYVAPVYKKGEVNGEPVVMIATDKFLVRFKEGVTEAEMEELHRQYNVTVVEPLSYAPRGYLLQAPSGPDAPTAVELANRYYESGKTEFAHPDFVRERAIKAVATTTYRGAVATVRGEIVEREEFAAQQWHLDVAKVRDAWSLTSGDSSIWIAVMDDGVDVGHAEFSGKTRWQFDYESDQTDGNPKLDSDKHGTACAGVAVAGGVKASGAAPFCSLMAIRTPRFLGDSDEAQMFKDAADQNADVISCSWGPADGTGATDPLPDATRTAIRYCLTSGRGGKGIPICWAAGNGDESVTPDGYASNPDVIAVGASTSPNSSGDEERSWYSDFGPEVWVCAPSSGSAASGQKRIFTTDRRGSVGYNPGDPAKGDSPGNYTNSFGGTSSATPLVAGVVGLMLSANKDLTATQVRNILRDTADKIGDSSSYDGSGHSNQFGYGRVNAFKAVQQAQSMAGGGGTTPTSGPSITGPSSISVSGPAPAFNITTGSNPFYAVEVAGRPELFHLTVNGSQRTDDNFYGSWKTPPFKSAPTFQLPPEAWDLLKACDRLYYRVLTSAAANSWTSLQASLGDAEWANAPSMAVTRGSMPPDGGGGSEPAEEVTYPSGARFRAVTSPQGGDFSDPIADGQVPLIEVGTRGEEKLATNFKLKELAAAGVRYARISPDLVRTLQAVRNQVGSLTVQAGYRRPGTPISGEPDDDLLYHQAGLAADIKSASKPPLELAKVAAGVMGGTGGLGLGGSYLHIDLRPEAKYWSYPGAAKSSADFDALIRGLDPRSDRVDGSYSRPAGPSITGPVTYDRTDVAPTFLIEPGRNRYFAVEVTTDWELFDRAKSGERRTSENFFASWAARGLIECPRWRTTYTLPPKAWSLLRGSAVRLYYRVVTASAAKRDWPGYQASTRDRDARDAPWVALKGGVVTGHSAPPVPTVTLPTTAASTSANAAAWQG